MLSDPAERAYYDATGKTAPQANDHNPDAKVYQLAIDLIADALGQISDPKRADVIQHARAIARDTRAKLEERVKQQETMYVRLGVAALRIKAPADDTRLKAMMESRLAVIERLIVEGKANLALLDRAAAFLDGYGYEVEPPPAPSYGWANQQAMGQGYYQQRIS